MNRLRASIIRDESVPWTSKFAFSSTNSDFELYAKFPSVQGHEEGLNRKENLKRSNNIFFSKGLGYTCSPKTGAIYFLESMSTIFIL
jgi:hypothetical protein